MPPRVPQLGDADHFRVYVAITGSAAKKFKGKREYVLRKRFFHRVVKVGDINIRRLRDMAKKTTKKTAEPEVGAFSLDENPTVIDHPHADLCYIEQSISFKLPDVLPQDYAMCEVSLRLGYVTTKDGIEEESKAILNRIGPIVTDQLDELAVLCGGVPVFTAQEEAKGEAEADKEK